MTVVVGIDPSIRATAVVVVPLDWGGDWERVRSFVIHGGKASPSMKERIWRSARIADDLRTRLTGYDFRGGAILIENYSFGSPFKAHQLGELGFALRSEMMRHALGETMVGEVAIPSARKLLLGKVPKEGAKVAVYSAIVAAAPRTMKFTLDEADAFCIANYGLSELGEFCLVGGGGNNG